jgi:hypothetical protein
MAEIRRRDGSLIAEEDWSVRDLVECYRADLQGANLRWFNLRGACLADAIMTGADLSGANLKDADLSCANLKGAVGLPDAPVVPDIDAAILAAIETPGNALNMPRWHTCETTHCRAGWAIVLAGEAGRDLELALGPNAAAALIYAASGSHPVPDWHASNAQALADLRKRAGRDG